jgi:phosphoenolpyruvate---glycerone phosphotransferase subunit DhaK
VGGGSGHEPLFIGYVGHNMADASVMGQIFAAPSPDLSLAAAKAVDGGAGVMFLYNNYAGDRLNFDMAADMAAAEGIDIRTVLVWDDVASGPPGEPHLRRGTAADVFVIHVAGTAAESGAPIDEVVRLTEKARDNCRSIGIALTSCTLPATGKATFEIGDGEMELGMGLHGEPGVKRTTLLSADDTAAMMLPLLLGDLPFRRGDTVNLLINGYGATTLMEMYIMNRAFHRLLGDAGITVHRSEIGNFCTTQEMAGCSLTLMRLDDELARLVDAPANCPAYTRF